MTEFVVTLLLCKLGFRPNFSLNQVLSGKIKVTQNFIFNENA